MKKLTMIALPLLALAFLTDCGNPADQETQAKARALSMAQAVRHTKGNSTAGEEKTMEPAESSTDEPAQRENEEKND
jgi:hypothetical protein